MKILIQNLIISELNILKSNIEYFIPSINKEQLNNVFENLISNDEIMIENYNISCIISSSYDEFDLIISMYYFNETIDILKKYGLNSYILRTTDDENVLLREYLFKVKCLPIISNNLHIEQIIFNNKNILKINSQHYDLLKFRLREITYKDFKRIIKLKQLL